MSQVIIPADYQEPHPDPALCGWGLEKFNPSQNLGIERASIEKAGVSDSITIVGAASAAGGTALDPLVEASIRTHFKFDKGWSFFVSEQIVYGLDDEETLMARQLIGNCVGDSHSCLLAAKIAHEILAEGDPEEPLGKKMLGIPFIPYSYGVGRRAGGMLGGGDGSYCGAQMEGTQKDGFLPCFTEGLSVYAGEGNAALPQGTANANRLFGRSNSEIEKWTAKAKNFQLLEIIRAKNADDVKVGVTEKFSPFQICAGVMPTFWKNDDKYGPLYHMSEPASHSTQIVAVMEFKGEWFYVVRNQWGQSAHLGNPLMGIPKGCMVCPLDDLNAWFRRGVECIGFGEIEGLPTNPGF